MLVWEGKRKKERKLEEGNGGRKREEGEIKKKGKKGGRGGNAELTVKTFIFIYLAVDVCDHQENNSRASLQVLRSKDQLPTILLHSSE